MTAAVYDLDLAPLDLSLDGVPRQPARRRSWLTLVRQWVHAYGVDLAIVAVLAFVAGAVHLPGMDTAPGRFDDEGTYTAYAWAVQNWHVLSHYTYWYAHPPVGWLQIAGWIWATDGYHRAPYAVAAAREFMFVCKLVAIALLYLLARRLRFGRLGAVLAVVFFAFSPLAVYFTRAALLDNVVTPWLLGAFLFAASPRRSIRGAVASAVCLSVAVLSKETALLYLPAVLLLLWQHTDRRNRRFVLSMFGAWFVVLCAAYPMYAIVKNELLIGPGHVSLEYAVRWQLFERTGSGSIFDPHSTASAVINSWLAQDPWLPMLALAVTVPGLLIRRTRAVAAAFAIQVLQLLRSGYLPYPYVIAMIPFAALTIAGVADWLWSVGCRQRFGVRPATGPAWALRLGNRVLDGLGYRWARLRRLVPGWPVEPGLRTRLRWAWRGGVATAVALLVVAVATGWSIPLHNLRTVNRDHGKEQALAWLLANARRDQYLVVDDSFWVDLVRAGHPADHVVWFTKLDVDKDVRIPGTHQWAGISYVVLDREDDLSVHIQADGKPSRDTLTAYPTLGKALRYSRVVASFGNGLDSITIRAVDPALAVPPARPKPAPVKPGPAGSQPAKARADPGRWR
jgi:4-amino-4-deoxy-L-arabinose transferase-like glycosyltransferase